MGVPSNPTWTSTISAAMIEAGRLNVSFGEVLNMSNRGAQDIKTELWAASRYDILLATETVVVVATGSSTVSLPTDFDHEESLTAYYGDGAYRGRAQAGNLSSLTLQASDLASTDAYNGFYLFLLAGTGSSQYSQISQFTQTTNIASVTTPWATTPDGTSDYLIGRFSQQLSRVGNSLFVTIPYVPSTYRITGTALTVWPPPDKIYPIVMVYQPNLTRIDETGTVFIKWLRERMALIKQGIKVKTMQLYDDDRLQQEEQKWEKMKAQYGAQNPTYAQMPFGNR